MIRTISLILFSLIAANAQASTNRYLDGQAITNGAFTLTLPSATGTVALTSDIHAAATIGAFDATPNANGLSISGQAISLSEVDATHPGGLSAAQYVTLSGKLSSSLTTGHFFLGVGGVATDSTASAATAALDAMVGDTGAGGTKGLVPAPASGDAAALKFLKADGTWATPSGQAPSVIGSTGSPTLITAVGGIAFTGSNYVNVKFVAGNGGAIDITASPQIAAGNVVGQRLTIIGEDATNTVKLEDGTGLALNGVMILGLNSAIELMYDGAVWVELSRR
jgi:hypothetical protein